MDGGEPGARSLGEVHSAAPGLAADVQGGAGAPAEALQSLRCDCVDTNGLPCGPFPAERPWAAWAQSEPSLTGTLCGFWQISLMEFDASHLSYAPSKLPFSSPATLCHLPPFPSHCHLAFCCVPSPLPSEFAHGVSFPGGQPQPRACLCMTDYINFPGDISGSCISFSSTALIIATKFIN